MLKFSPAFALGGGGELVIVANQEPQIISLKDSKNNILTLTSLLESAKTGKLLSIKNN